MGTLAPRRFNRDGTRNIYCSRCGRLVGTHNGSLNFGSVTSCEVCEAADRGEVLPAEVLEQLNAVRLPGDGLLVPQFVTQVAKHQAEAAKTDPLSTNLEDTLTSRFWLKAATIKVVQTVRELVSKGSGAQKLAREKKRKRIFDRPLEEELNDE